MPFAPLRSCRQPGCPNRQSGSWCAAHVRTSPRNHRGVSRHARGHGAGYDRVRRELAGQPCALRLTGCTGVSTSADYTRPGDWDEPAPARLPALPACPGRPALGGALMPNPPVPTVVKQARGTARPDRANKDEPKPSVLIVGSRPPSWIKGLRRLRAWQDLSRAAPRPAPADRARQRGARPARRRLRRLPRGERPVHRDGVRALRPAGPLQGPVHRVDRARGRGPGRRSGAPAPRRRARSGRAVASARSSPCPTSPGAGTTRPGPRKAAS